MIDQSSAQPDDTVSKVCISKSLSVLLCTCDTAESLLRGLLCQALSHSIWNIIRIEQQPSMHNCSMSTVNHFVCHHMLFRV